MAIAKLEERPLTPNQQTAALALKEVLAQLQVDRKKLEHLVIPHRYATLRRMAEWAGVNYDRLEEELAKL